jgi:hypothetical protein
VKVEVMLGFFELGHLLVGSRKGGWELFNVEIGATAVKKEVFPVN